MWREANMKSNQFWAAVSNPLLVITVTLIVALMLAPGAWAASKYKILHKFTRADGGNPEAALIFDASGNLYSTTIGGGCCGNGTVFKLTPNVDGSWTESMLYSFTGGRDGGQPTSALIFDASGSLYGTTNFGGNDNDGTVYKLTRNSDGSWIETVIHSFNGRDGEIPVAGLVFDATGNLYGTATLGGAYGHGVVFKLAPNSGGSWTESTLHDFKGGKDGGYPDHGHLIFDAAGNLYGVTAGWYGGDSNGTVFELTPNSDGSWTQSVLYNFSGGEDGAVAQGTLAFDPAGRLYGTTLAGGTYGQGTVFKLTLGSDGKWVKHVLHQFKGGTDGAVPFAGVVFDTAGHLHGTTFNGGGGLCDGQWGTGCGTIFKLIPNSTGGWTYQVPRRYKGLPASEPMGAVLIDAAGNLYLTTASLNDGHGTGGNGTVGGFEITP
jgi:uncharacterized repeat protein (TIGR03803 family)